MEYIKYQERVRKEEAAEREHIRKEEKEAKERLREEKEQQRQRDWEARERKWEKERELMREQFALLLEKNQEERKELHDQVKRQMEKQDADRRLQIIRAELPKLPGMGPSTDIEEYLELFEAHMTRGEYPRAAWSGQLQPLLNDDCRSAVLQLNPDSRDVYDASYQSGRRILEF